MDDLSVTTEERDVAGCDQQEAVTSRRRMFQIGSIGAAALAGGVVAEAVGAQAASATVTPVALGQPNTTTTTTSITTTASADAFQATCSTGSGAGVVGSGSPGVHGTGSSAAAPGVVGSGNPGVKGTTSTNHQSGVVGADTSAGGGSGVAGTSVHGVGVAAASSAGIALSVLGKAKFSRSGKAQIATGNSSIKVNLLGVSPSSLVLATLQRLESNTFLAAVVPGTNSFTISLNRPATAPLHVAWLVLN